LTTPDHPITQAAPREIRLPLGPVGIRRLLDFAGVVFTLATLLQLGDPDVLLHVVWVVLAIGAFLFGLKVALFRILLATVFIAGYSLFADTGLAPSLQLTPLELSEWPLMVAISLIVALMADRVSATARHYAFLYRKANDRLLTAHEDERARIARDLHDGVGQTLTAVILTLDAAESVLWSGSEPPSPLTRSAIRRAQELAATALEEARDVGTRLRPSRIHEIGLGPAIRDLAGAAGVPVEVRFDPQILPAGLLTADREIEAYRVVQEAVGNAARHGHAARIWISAAVDEKSIVLEVCDDGVGFDPALTAGQGLGLAGMQDRADVLMGRLKIVGAPGAGATIILTIPRSREAQTAYPFALPETTQPQAIS